MRWVRLPFYLFGKVCALAFIFIGGGLLASLILPLAMIFPGQRQKKAQFLIYFSFRFYIRALQFCGLIRLRVNNAQEFAACGGKMVIANHPSLLDVVILMALIPNAQCIIKHQLWTQGFLGGLLRSAGYIRNDLEPEKLIEACAQSLDEGRCLIIFPEGTRTLPGTVPHFQRGFANIATLTKAPIQPVLIDCSPAFLFKGEQWWRVPVRTPFFQISLGECLDEHSYSLYGQRAIMARKLVESLELYYAAQTGYGRS